MQVETLQALGLRMRCLRTTLCGPKVSCALSAQGAHHEHHERVNDKDAHAAPIERLGGLNSRGSSVACSVSSFFKYVFSFYFVGCKFLIMVS